MAAGLIDTGMIAGVSLNEATKLIPMRRVGRPEDVAGAAGFLCSDAASYVTRQVISVNGGMV